MVYSILSSSVFAQGTPPAASKQRGMYVSCGDVLIEEILSNGNTYDSLGHTPATQELFEYAHENYFNYIAVYSLAKKMNGGATLIGDSTYWDALREFLKTAHSKGIQVGMVVTNKDFLDPTTQAPTTTFFTSPFYYNLQQPLYTCGYDTIDPLDFSVIGTDGINALINPAAASIFEYEPAETEALLPTVYPELEQAEMCKSIMQLLKYSFQTKQWHYQNHNCANCNEEEFAELQAPPLAEHLFDFISIEYEYWDDDVYEKFIGVGASYKTEHKKAWDNFVVLTKSAFYAQKMMCGTLKTELELKLIGLPFDNSFTTPIHPWDTAAGNIPIPSVQAAFMGKYYNRILLSDYKKNYAFPNMISLVGAGMKWLSDNPSSLTPKTEIMPIFSASLQGEEKHCFGSYLLDSLNNPVEWPDDFFGFWLQNATATNTPGINMYNDNELRFFEAEFLIQCDSAKRSGFQCNHCQEDDGANVQCTFSITNDTIIGYMWYNYSTLNNTTTGSFAHQYHRKASSTTAQTTPTKNPIIAFSNEEKKIGIYKGRRENFYQVKIYSNNGSLLISKDLKNEIEFLSVSNLPAGIYFVQLLSTGFSETKKITVIH